MLRILAASRKQSLKGEKVVSNITKHLLERQVELEQEGINEGIAKFQREFSKAQQNGSLNNNAVGAALMFRFLPAFCTAVKTFVEQAQKENKQAQLDKVRLIRAVGINECAFIALRCIIASFGGKEVPKAIHLALEIGQSIAREKAIKELKQTPSEAFGTYNAYITKALKANNQRGASKVRTLNNIIGVLRDQKGLEVDLLDKELKVRLGVELIDIFHRATGLIEKVDVYCGSKGKIAIGFKPVKQFVTEIDNIKAHYELLSPVYFPMLIPPLPFHNNNRAGFITPALQVPLVKDHFNKPKRYLNNHNMPVVYEVLNVIQNTPWRINKEVFEVYNELISRGYAVPELDIVSADGLGIPPKPWGTLNNEEFKKYKEANPEVVKAWVAEANNAHNTNARNTGKRIMSKSIAVVAERFKDEERFYYCYNLDHRGRVYPIQSGNCPNPQGFDASKALR